MHIKYIYPRETITNIRANMKQAYTCLHVCACVIAYACVFICACGCVCARETAYACVYVHVAVCVDACACVCAYGLHACAPTCMCMYNNLLDGTKPTACCVSYKTELVTPLRGRRDDTNCFTIVSFTSPKRNSTFRVAK